MFDVPNIVLNAGWHGIAWYRTIDSDLLYDRILTLILGASEGSKYLKCLDWTGLDQILPVREGLDWIWIVAFGSGLDWIVTNESISYSASEALRRLHPICRMRRLSILCATFEDATKLRIFLVKDVLN